MYLSKTDSRDMTSNILVCSNIGLLKLGFRTTFSLIGEQLERYIQITNI